MILINLRFRKPWQWTQWRQMRQFQESMRDRASPFVKKLGPSTSRPRPLAPDAHTMPVTTYIQGSAFSRGHLFKLQSVCGPDTLIHPMSGSPTQHSPRRSKMADRPQQPSVGRVVHYQSHGSPNGQHKSEPRAAIVTKVLTGLDTHEVASVSLCVLNPSGMYFDQAIAYDPEGSPGTWRWPPRV